MMATEDQQEGEERRKVILTPSDPDDWPGLFAKVSSSRILLVHHGDELQGEDDKSGWLGAMVSFIVDAVSHRRSVLKINGLRCLAELFSCVVRERLSTEQVETLVGATGLCHKSSFKLCNTEVEKAMETALSNADPMSMLGAVLSQALDDHPKVACRGLIYSITCLSRLGVGSVAGGGLVDGLDVKSLMLALAKGAKSVGVDGKDAAWRGVQMCREALGKDAFEATIAKDVDRIGVRAIHDLVAWKAKQQDKANRAAATRRGAGGCGGLHTSARRAGLGGRRGRVIAGSTGTAGGAPIQGGLAGSSQVPTWPLSSGDGTAVVGVAGGRVTRVPEKPVVEITPAVATAEAIEGGEEEGGSGKGRVQERNGGRSTRS